VADAERHEADQQHDPEDGQQDDVHAWVTDTGLKGCQRVLP
jgi:hypothetical protein